MEVENKRQEWVDFLKGIAIISVIYLHAYNGYEIDNTMPGNILKIITSFHMALFFSLSGYFFKYNKTNYKKNLKKKSYVLLIPYVVWGIVLGFVIENIRVLIRNHEVNVLETIRDIVTLQESYLSTWFLIVLFGVYFIELIVANYYQKIKNSKTLFLIVTHVIFLIGAILLDYTSFGGYFRLKWIFMASIFFFLGNCLKEIKLNKGFSLILIIIGCIVPFYNERVCFSNFEFGNLWMFLCGSFSIIIGLVSLFKFNYKTNKIFMQIEKIGKDSMIVLITHMVLFYVIRIIEKILNMQIHTFSPEIACIFVVCVEYIILLLFNKMPNFVRISFGKEKKEKV